MDQPATSSNISENNEVTSTPSLNSREDNKRRSSSRSIKRRRFDDELVEYSLQPGASIGKGDRRMRTQSHTSQLSEFPVSSTSPAGPANPPQERKRSKGPSTGNGGRKARRKGQLSQLSTKDLGRWKPTDDLALILGVQQTNDLRTVHRGIKFSCRFTLSELQSRWYALLYNAEISRVAVAAMGNLHPDVVTAIHQQALFSKAEEDILGTLRSNSHPTIDKFQALIDANADVFYPTRTAKAIMNHWQLLRQYGLLPDQINQPLPKGVSDDMLTFSEAEEMLNDSELQDYKDDGMDLELQIADRLEKKNIRLLENAVSRWQVLVQSVAGGGVELDRNTLAVLRGRLVRYLMRSREIAVGRGTKYQSIDVDLTLEGPATKVSRKQATIRLQNSGEFYITSEGKRPIFVNGRPILQGDKAKLDHNSIIDIAGLHFVFLVNQELISAIRLESVNMNIS